MKYDIIKRVKAQIMKYVILFVFGHTSNYWTNWNSKMMRVRGNKLIRRGSWIPHGNPSNSCWDISIWAQSGGLTDAGIPRTITNQLKSTSCNTVFMFCWYLRCSTSSSLCVSLQSVGALRHQPNDHPEHRHRVRADPDASRARQRQHGGEYGLPEPGGGAHPQRVWPHLWNEGPLLIFSDRGGEGGIRNAPPDQKKAQVVQRLSSSPVDSCGVKWVSHQKIITG